MKRACWLSLAVVSLGCVGEGLDVEQSAQALIEAPRQIAPLSSSTVTAQAPTLRWEAAPGSLATHIQVCADRACNVVERSWTAWGNTGPVPSALSPGVHYWRAAGVWFTRPEGPFSTAVWQFRVRSTNTAVQTSWGTDPDFNGDGRSDVAIGRPDAYGGLGLVSVLSGTPAGAGSPSAVLAGAPSLATHFGAEVASVGDVNGDGFADLAVGCPNETNNGAVRFFKGTSSGVSTAAVVIPGPAGAGSTFGGVIRAAGDINHDGYGDFVVSARAVPNASPRGTGRVYVYYGGPLGPSSAPALTLINPILLTPQDDFGVSLASADVNGDGHPDLMVGAPVGSSTGWVVVYHGAAAGLPATPTMGYNPALTGRHWSDFGRAMAAGDANGDGYADLAVARPFDTRDAGNVWVYHGSATGLNANVNGNTYITQNTMPSGLWDDGWFGTSLSFGSDVNGDGFDDLVVGAPNGQTAAPAPALRRQGRFHVYHGGATGLNPVNATLIWGTVSNERVGQSVGGLADVNGDGFGDLVVGAAGAIPAVRVYRGTPAGVALQQTIAGPSNEGFGRALTSR